MSLADWYTMTWAPRRDGLLHPLQWKNRAHVLLTEDLFAERDWHFLEAVLGVVAACPRHTFSLMTSNPWAAGEWATSFRHRLSGTPGESLLHALASLLPLDKAGGAHEKPILETGWPLANLRVGGNADSQEAIATTVPHLLGVPAGGHFLNLIVGDTPLSVANYLTPPDTCCLACGATTLEYESHQVRNSQHPHLEACVACGTAFTARLDWLWITSTTRAHRGALAVAAEASAAGVPFFVDGWGPSVPQTEQGPRGQLVLATTRAQRSRLTCTTCRTDLAVPGKREDTDVDGWMEASRRRWQAHLAECHLDAWPPLLRRRDLPDVGPLLQNRR